MPSGKKEWPRRPPRLGRLFDTARPFYFVTFNTHKRQGFLARPEVHEAFCVFCSKAREHDVAVGRYVIMPDHVHLFAAFPARGITLSVGFNRCATRLAKLCSVLEFTSRTCRKAFSDHLLRSQESYSQKWEYVRMNPVRAKLSETPQAWPFQGQIIPISFD
jgi:putative transposase